MEKSKWAPISITSPQNCVPKVPKSPEILKRSIGDTTAYFSDGASVVNALLQSSATPSLDDEMPFACSSTIDTMERAYVIFQSKEEAEAAEQWFNHPTVPIIEGAPMVVSRAKGEDFITLDNLPANTLPANVSRALSGSSIRPTDIQVKQIFRATLRFKLELMGKASEVILRQHNYWMKHGDRSTRWHPFRESDEVSMIKLEAPSPNVLQTMLLDLRTVFERTSAVWKDLSVIELDDALYQWAMHEGGIQQVKEAFGDEVQLRGVVKGTKRIRFIVNQRSAKPLKDFIDRFEASVRAIAAGTVGDCAICFTPAEDPIITSCGHTYCSGCLQGQCAAAEKGNSGFRICCMGAEGQCERAFTISELRSYLTSKDFEALLRRSFDAYVSRHHKSLRHCGTPGCVQVYAVQQGPQAAHITCSQCFQRTCPACHCPHEGYTCQEWASWGRDGQKELEAIKQELGVKDCPECRTPTDKSEGCNHMTCPGCGTHFCWTCLASFSEARLCYGHMLQAHGRYTDEPEFLDLVDQ